MILVSLKTIDVENYIETSSDLFVNMQFYVQFHLRSGVLKPQNVQKNIYIYTEYIHIKHANRACVKTN